MSNAVYTTWKGIQLGSTVSGGFTEGPINFLTADIKVALLASTYGDPASSRDDDWWTDVSSHEVSSSNYTSGGASLTGKGITIDDANYRALFDAADVSWASVTFSPQYAALYYAAASGNQPLICAFDFGSAQSASNGNFQITWSSSPQAVFGLT